MENILFEGARRFERPFEHLEVERVLSERCAEELLSWLETADSFVFSETTFYREFSFHISRENAPERLSEFFAPANLAALKQRVEQAFGVPLEDKFYLSANKRVHGHGSLVHNDYVEGAGRSDPYFFTHRFLIYLTRDWREEHGGLLGLFGGPDAEQAVKAVAPRHNTGVGMAMGPRSFHAVSNVTAGTRYTLNFSFIRA